jgi:hypothetical protein
MKPKLKCQFEPSEAHPFFLYDPEGQGVTYYATTAERDAAAEAAIADCLEDGEWWEDTGMICVGVVTHSAQKVDVIRREDVVIDLEDGLDGEGRSWPPGIDEMYNYKMKSIWGEAINPRKLCADGRACAAPLECTRIGECLSPSLLPTSLEEAEEAVVTPPAPNQAPFAPEKILLRVDLFKPEGKWKYGFEVEVPNTPLAEPYEILSNIDQLQNDLVRGTVTSGQYTVVLDDSPEQARNPHGSFFFKRLYTNRQVIQAMLNAPPEDAK